MSDSHTCIRTISLILSALVIFEISGTNDYQDRRVLDPKGLKKGTNKTRYTKGLAHSGRE
jgi:hypothetical protein